MPTNYRHICGIERALRGGVNTQHTKYDKQKVEEHKLEIREILGIVNPRSLSFGENLGAIESPTVVAPATTSVAESGMSSAPPLLAFCATLVTSRFILPSPACQRLIKRAFALHELPSLNEAVFSSADVDDIIRRICVGDAQAFIDVMNEVRIPL